MNRLLVMLSITIIIHVSCKKQPEESQTKEGLWKRSNSTSEKFKLCSSEFQGVFKAQHLKKGFFAQVDLDIIQLIANSTGYGTQPKESDRIKKGEELINRIKKLYKFDLSKRMAERIAKLQSQMQSDIYDSPVSDSNYSSGMINSNNGQYGSQIGPDQGSEFNLTQDNSKISPESDPALNTKPEQAYGTNNSEPNSNSGHYNSFSSDDGVYGSDIWKLAASRLFASSLAKLKKKPKIEFMVSEVMADISSTSHNCSTATRFTEQLNIEDHWNNKMVDQDLLKVLDDGLKYSCDLLGVNQETKCENFFRSIFEILSPHGSITKGNFEHGVLDFYYSKLVFEDPKFDQFFGNLKQIMDSRLLVKAAPKQPNSTNSGPYSYSQALSTKNLGNFWDATKEAANGNSVAATRIFSMLSHDTIPYSYQSIVLRLVADGQYRRAIFYERLMNKSTTSNNFIVSSWLSRPESVPEFSGIRYKKYHAVAGAGVACELLQKGYSQRLAILGSTLVGVGYEAIDFGSEHLNQAIQKFKGSDNSYEASGGSTYPSEYPTQNSVNLTGNQFEKLKMTIFNFEKLKNWAKRAKVFSKDIKESLIDGYRDSKSHYLGAQFGAKKCGTK